MLTQFKSRGLNRHIENIQYSRQRKAVRGRARSLPTVQTDETSWSEGTADAVTQNIDLVQEEKPDIVNVFAADHVYLMDITQMNEYHLQNDADLTISAMPVKRKLAAKELGVLKVNAGGKLIEFEEKPVNPSPMPGHPDLCLASMGNYAFKPRVLVEYLKEDSKKETTRDTDTVKANPEHFSKHDFSFDIIPAMMKDGLRIFGYDFGKNTIRGSNKKPYWRDVGHLHEFYDANMELTRNNPPIDLYNSQWPIFTHVEIAEPARIISGEGYLIDSLLANGVIIKNSKINRCVLSYGVQVEHNSNLEKSVFLGYNQIGRNVKIKNTIIDRGVSIPNGEEIGVDLEKDRERGFTISQERITIVPADYQF